MLPRVLLLFGCWIALSACSESGGSDSDRADATPGSGGSTSGGTGGGAGVSGTAGVGAAGSGGSPASCDAACSGHGTCVEVGGNATCACERGYYDVGTSCLLDPCEGGGTCFYLDAESGSDAGDGSLEQPWKTSDKLAAEAPALPPGSYVLFRRGRDWSSTNVTLSGVTGTEAQPITFGGYGPLDDARPKFRAFHLVDSNHVTLRDIESSHSDKGPCITIVESGHVSVRDVFVHDCQNNGIYFGEATHHGVIADSTITTIPNNDAISIHNPGELNEQTKLGDHFWVIDNHIPGPVAEEPIDIATGSDTIAGSRDIKIVGNLTARGGSGCIAVSHGTSVAWIIGNTLGICPTKETAGALRVGGNHGALSGDHFQIRGNLLFQNRMSNLIYGDPEISPEVTVDQNTIVTLIGERAAWTHTQATSKVVFTRNIVAPTGGNAHIQFLSDALGLLTQQDDNWFVPGDDPGCEIGKLGLSAWQSQTGFDLGSSCAAIPGMSAPDQAAIEDSSRWNESDFLDHFVPSAEWPGCADGIGAFDCDGKRRIRFEPMPGYDEHGGLGWRGPLIVQQRYPLD